MVHEWHTIRGGQGPGSSGVGLPQSGPLLGLAQDLCYEMEGWLDKQFSQGVFKVWGKQAVASFLWERIRAPKQSLAQSAESGDH